MLILPLRALQEMKSGESGPVCRIRLDKAAQKTFNWLISLAKSALILRVSRRIANGIEVVSEASLTLCITSVLSHGIAGEHDGAHSAPPGTMVSAIQSMENQTFYINGRAPPYSTAKPVRFIVIERDDGLLNVPISELTWSQMHAYPNWTGPIKVPAGKF